MDSLAQSLLQSLCDALALLHPNAGASVALCDPHGRLVERARSGALTALAHLPPVEDTPIELSGVFDGLGTGWRVVSVELCGRNRGSLGLIRLAVADEPPPGLIAAVKATAAHAALSLEQSLLHQELQRSFNTLFIVYEAGHLLNFSRDAEDVFAQVLGLLVRTLHFSHCAILLLDGDTLMPAAHSGVAPSWAEGGQVPLDRSFAARVLEAGAPAQFEDRDNLDGVILPLLDTGAAPTSVLCAPLTTRAGTLGALEIYRATGEPFTDDEVFVASVLAVETAAALENARLYEALREREERLTDYAAKLVNSQEEERRRISRDIHDGLGQSIVSAFQYLQAHEYTLPEGHPRDAFDRGLGVLQECIRETRRVMSDLRPSTLDDFGLVVALQQQLDATASEAGWEASFVLDGSVERLSPAVETTVFRVVQEALTNARKHARASKVRVGLARRDGDVVVEVRDWGRGFVVGGVAARPERGEHLGLMGMRERVSLLGGTVDIDSAPGDGTNVRIVLPAPAA